jgi:hypothetical protein
MDISLESFWGELLSKDPTRIRAALDSLGQEEQSTVLDHLRRMATQDGWSEGQRLGAEAALRVIEGK